MNTRIKNKWQAYPLIWVLAIFISSCTKDGQLTEINSKLEVPDAFPSMNFPEDNSFSNDRWELGKALFFDPVLSKDSSISCATCHQPAFAFADNNRTTPGVDSLPGTRNVPSLTNVGYQPYFLKEGGIPTLEMQVLVPIQEENEFNHNIVLIIEQLADNEKYQSWSQRAYDRPIDPFVLTRAIGLFERSLISGNSGYDKFENGNTKALNASEINGKKLFFSDKTKCSSCHSGFNFTSYEIVNNGLYETYSDPGKYRLTLNESDRGKFKIPSLRNVGVTAPYMHDGSVATLEEVIDHYQSGGFNHPNKSELIQPFTLTDNEKNDLINFLNALTDFHFINDERWK